MNLFKPQLSFESHPFKWWHIPLLLILVIGTIFVFVQNNHNTNEWKTCEGNIFGTIYHITYNSSVDYSDSIIQELGEVDNSLSTFNKKSTISLINDNKTDKMDSLMLNVVNTAQIIYNETGGAFDITVAPLVNIWGFGFKKSDVADSLKIDSILEFVGMDKIQVIDSRIKKTDSRLMFDCSAIAKGFGVDMVSNLFIRNGVKDFMVEIGGEVRTAGTNRSRQAWRIGINEPIDVSSTINQNIQNVIELSDMSIATSGNYRNFYIKDGKKYAHTIDPKTGFPIQHTLLSSTVIAKDCMTADAYATAFMVLGLEKSKKILNNHKELKAYFIYSKDDGSNGVWHSSGLLLEEQY